MGTHNLEQYEYFWFALGNEKDTLSKSAIPYFSPDTTTSYILKVLDFKFDWSVDTITVKVVECGKPTTLNIYPNPTNNIVKFKFNSPIPEQLKIELYDVIGRKIRSTNYQQNYDINEVQMNLFDLASGMYFYRVLIGNEQKFCGKIVLLR